MSSYKFLLIFLISLNFSNNIPSLQCLHDAGWPSLPILLQQTQPLLVNRCGNTLNKNPLTVPHTIPKTKFIFRVLTLLSLGIVAKFLEFHWIFLQLKRPGINSVLQMFKSRSQNTWPTNQDTTRPVSTPNIPRYTLLNLQHWHERKCVQMVIKCCTNTPKSKLLAIQCSNAMSACQVISAVRHNPPATMTLAPRSQS